VADITYVRLREAFAYLAIILDGFSRKVVGWALAPYLDASLAVEALDHALADRKPAPASLVHHSDRGVQYASTEYRQRLANHEITVSKAESFMKTTFLAGPVRRRRHGRGASGGGAAQRELR
jgi:putative transposase